MDAPFPVTPATGRVTVRVDEPSLTELRALVAGAKTGMARSRAMALLVKSDWPNKHRDLEGVLRNDREPPEIRYAAAIHLGRAGSRGALEVLVDATEGRDERVLAGVVKALGWIGDTEEALAKVRHVRDAVRGSAVKAATFASLLIAHRLGIVLDRPPPLADLLSLEDGSGNSFHVREADAEEAEFCLRCLSGQPLAIEFLERPMYQIRCGPYVLMLVLSREWVRGLTNIGRPALAAVVARRISETNRYSLSLFVLLTPERGMSARLSLWRTTGDLIYRGATRLIEQSIQFSLATARRPGAVPVNVEGEFTGAALELHTALSANIGLPKLQPEVMIP